MNRFCGGPSRVLIYNNPSVQPSNPTNPTTPGGSWAPAQGGCWRDNVDHDRALEHLVGNFDDLTIEKCLNLCDAQGFNLAGVEYSRECCKYLAGSNPAIVSLLTNIEIKTSRLRKYCERQQSPCFCQHLQHALLRKSRSNLRRTRCRSNLREEQLSIYCWTRLISSVL